MQGQVSISEKKKAFTVFLKEELNWSYHTIAARCKISTSSIERICKQGMECKAPTKKSGRPQILSARDRGRFLRKFKSLREENPNITVGLVAMECELHQVSSRTLSRILNESGYKYVRPRRKGIRTASDKKKRVAYAAKALKNTTPMFWTDDGAVVVEEYTKMNGQYFSEFIESKLHRALITRAAATGKENLLFVQDNDPSQNSAKANESLKTIGAEVVKITPRSPDLNPIENFFHNVKLRQDALDKRLV